MKVLTRWLTLTIITLAFVLASCGSEETGDSTEPSIGDDGETTTEVGTVINDGFWVGAVPNPNMTLLMHEKNSITTSCMVKANTSSNESLECILNTGEGNVFVDDIELHINVPPKMCNYVEFRSYWYYNMRPGKGPAAVYIRKVVDDAGDFRRYDCSLNGGVSFVDCSTLADTDEYSVSLLGTPICHYDYKNRFHTSNPNCCTGSYVYTTETYDEVDLEYEISTKSTLASWGDSYDTECFGGPAAKDRDWPKGGEGHPGLWVFNSYDKGRNLSYKVLRVIANYEVTGNYSTANYYDPANYAATGNKPTSIWGGDYNSGGGFEWGEDLSGDAMANAQDTYEFRCLDENYDSIHRIRVKIREWNTNAEYLKYVAGNAAADDNVVGNEDDTDCEYGANPGGYCNDFRDWGDKFTADALDDRFQSGLQASDYPNERWLSSWLAENGKELFTPLLKPLEEDE